MVFQTSTNAYSPLVSMVRAVTWLVRSSVTVNLDGLGHYVTLVLKLILYTKFITSSPFSSCRCVLSYKEIKKELDFKMTYFVN